MRDALDFLVDEGNIGCGIFGGQSRKNPCEIFMDLGFCFGTGLRHGRVGCNHNFVEFPPDVKLFCLEFGYFRKYLNRGVEDILFW